MTLRVGVNVTAPVEKLVFGYMIRDRLGQTIFGTNTHHTEQVVVGAVVGQSLTFSADFTAMLGPGTYSVSVALSDAQDHLGHNYEWRDMALVFSVANMDKQYFIGTSWIPPDIHRIIAPHGRPCPRQHKQRLDNLRIHRCHPVRKA